MSSFVWDIEATAESANVAHSHRLLSSLGDPLHLAMTIWNFRSETQIPASTVRPHTYPLKYWDSSYQAGHSVVRSAATKLRPRHFFKDIFSWRK